MTSNEVLRQRMVSGLRTRFNPKSRIGQGLFSVAPWINLVLLMLFYLLICFRCVLQPGFIVELPQAGFDQGSRFGLTVFIISVAGVSGSGKSDIVFFDDERFIAGSDEQMKKLKDKFVARASENPEAVLVVQAGKSISHGTVVSVIESAQEAGFNKVNVGVRSF